MMGESQRKEYMKNKYNIQFFFKKYRQIRFTYMVGESQGRKNT